MRPHQVAAALTVVMAGLVGAGCATGSTRDAYVLILVGALVLGSLVVAGRLWRGATFASSLGAVTLALLTISGQTLVCTAGSPGSSGAHWSVLAVAVICCALLVLALIAAETPSDAPPTSRDAELEHPYAL